MLSVAVQVGAQELALEGEHPLIVHADPEPVDAASRPLLDLSQDAYGIGADLRQPYSVAPALLASVQERRSPWVYPIIGTVVGAAAGAALGYYAMASTQDYLAPPAYLVAAPLGAVIGALAGMVANAVHPPE